MKKVIFHDLIKKERQKRILSINEEFVKRGYLYRAEKKTIFRIKEIYAFDKEEDAGRWIEQKLNNNEHPGRLSALRIYNETAGINICRYKMISFIYVMYDTFVFTVLHLQTLKASVEKESKKA